MNLFLFLVGCREPAPEDAGVSEDSGTGDTAGQPEAPPDALVYVIERYEGTLYALDRATAEIRWQRDDLPPTVGLAVDGEGFIYLAATDTDDVGSLMRVSPDGASVEQLVPPDGTLLRPQGLWYDAHTDTVLLADVNAARVYEVWLDDLSLTVLTDAVPEPSDAARRPGEDTLYVSSRSEGRLYVVDSSGSGTPLAGSVPDAHSIIPGPDGVVYVMASGLNALVSIAEESGEATELAAHFSSAPAVGLCIDPWPGGLMVTDHGGHTMHHYDLAAGTTSPFFKSDWDLYECGHSVPPDSDGDGWISTAHAGTDCDDQDAAVFPGQGC
ncbi:MAG: hypothetical protein ACI8RZ_003024 [Myxococcota bacterium]|jgi:hypothetical protein